MSAVQPELQPLSPDPVSGAAPDVWPLPKRFLFRFAFCYLLLYTSPRIEHSSILGHLPGGDWITKPYIELWKKIVPWVAIHAFHQSGRAVTYFPTGSGDTTLDYVQAFCFLVVAATAALVWSVLDRKSTDHRRLHAWLRILVRYTLAVTMLSYGFAKVFPLQFRPTPFYRLIEPFGEFSPMGALWSFMGGSQPYTMISGAVEVLGGLLLFTRRTTTLGALVSAVALANVGAMNFCYDVPVKLYSSHLLFMAVLLLGPDLRRLVDVFLRNRPAAPADLSAPAFTRRGLRIAAVAVQICFVGWVLFDQVSSGWKAYRQAYIHPARPPLYGLYEVETFTRNGQSLPPLVTDPERWGKVAVDFPGLLVVRTTNGSTRYFGSEYDIGKSTVALASENNKSLFAYSRPDPDGVLLEGSLGSDRLSIRLQRIDTSKFLLSSRGFHWLQEFPFNR